MVAPRGTNHVKTYQQHDAYHHGDTQAKTEMATHTPISLPWNTKDANKMERVCYNRMRAAELARDSVFALVPCQEMARDSGALGSCTGEARDSLWLLWGLQNGSRACGCFA